MSNANGPNDSTARDDNTPDRVSDGRPDPPGSLGRPQLSAVPLFPLPGVVLFPRAILPLHIFEERYKRMTADALDGDPALSQPRQIAMALLKPGWEKCYYSRATIEPVVCVGTILSHERLPDGRYNFLLQGHTRARVIREYREGVYTDRPYRVAELEPLPVSHVLEIDFSAERDRLGQVFADTPLAGTSLGRQMRQLLAGPLPTCDLADLIAFNVFDDVGLKQSLLAEPDTRRRVQKTVSALERLLPILQPGIGGNRLSFN